MDGGGGGGGGSVAVIDMEKFPAQSALLVEACEGLGCFRVINHRVPLPLMAEMKSVVRQLLDLPAETKRRNADVIAGSGYMAPTPTNPLYEALGLYDINSPAAVDAFCDQLDATPHQRETIKTYAQEIHELMMDLGCKIAIGLGVERDDAFRKWPVQFRINKYSFKKENIGSLGVQVHTDSGFLTILQEDECVGGLQVMSREGRFIPVDPVPGSLLINLGDISKAWSNGRLSNVKHMVKCTEAIPRVTIATFLLGPKDEEVHPPPNFVDNDHPRLYCPFTYEGYRKQRLSTNLHCGEALDQFYNFNMH